MDELKLFACDTSSDYGQAVAAAAGVTLTPHEERDFEDGEFKIRPLESAAGADAYVIQSLYAQPEASAADKWLRALFLAAAVRDAGAGRVTLVLPYLAFSRKDRRTQPYDPLHTRYLAQMAEALGVSAVVTIDVHNLAAFQNAFRCRAEAVTAASLFAQYLLQQEDPLPWLVLSPDAGGMKRAEAFRKRLARASGREVALGMMEKFRAAGELKLGRLMGDVADRHVLIVDDMVASGRTLAHAARACRGAGAKRVTAFATHGLFAEESLKVLAEPALDRLVVTDTVPPIRAAGLGGKLTLLDSGPLLGEVIRRLHTHNSVAEFAGA